MNNQIKYVENSYSKTGTAFVDTTLEAVLKHCLTLPKTGKKGSFGAIFVYDSNQLAIHTDCTLSTGLILIDIDCIDKQTAETIYNNFSILVENFPSLLAIQFSSSYYLKPKEKCGLHIYIRSERLDENEYNKQAQICLSGLSQIINKFLNIDLLGIQKSTGKLVLDFHNANMWQRFVLFYSEFKYNEYAEKFTMDMISFEDLERLTVQYNLKLDRIISKSITPTTNNVVFGKPTNKIKIDRYLHIGGMSGNDIRFRISIIADKLFGDNAKSFCDKFFYYENNRSIYTHYTKANTMHPLIYKWLVSNGYIIENKQNIINSWLDEYANEIINNIRNNHILEIIAPTGSGKTTFINNFLAKQFNSVVIVPFNVTNKLYDNLFEINANYSGKIPNNKPLVMIWDQAIKHWEEIKDRHFIVDEAHTLFFDRNYRESAIKLINKFKEDNSHVTFITATPAGECELFSMKQSFYYKYRDPIQLNIKATKNIEWSQYNYIKKCLDNNWYDKIVLLDDISAKKIYEQFIVNGYGEQISYIRSSTKDSQDFIDLRNNELLSKRLTICTCVAFNGLNFKNKNENILVIGSIQQGMTTSCEIIQQIGRIRNSKVTGIYFYNPDKTYIEDIDKKEQKALECNNMVIKGCVDTTLSYDRKYLNNDYVNALRTIQKYQLDHSNIDVIITELGATGYIIGYVEDKIEYNEETIRMSLAIKKNESDELKNDIINNTFLSKEYDKEYQEKWAKEIRYMISNTSYSGITIEMFIEMFSKGVKNKLIDTTINYIKDVIRYVSIDDLEFQNTIANMNIYMSMLSNDLDKKQFKSNIKRIKEIRDTYKNKIRLTDNNKIFDNVINDVIQWEINNQQKKIEGNKTGGKKCKQIKDLETGIIYESCEDCAKAIARNITYISKHKARFVKVN